MTEINKPIDLQVETIAALNARMDAGELTARLLTAHCLAEIGKRDPLVNAVLEVNPDALDIADQLDSERVRSGPRSPLHGMPILIKDNIDTADRMTTTAGSLALLGTHADPDAFVVRQLRAAGAIVLGKTNLSEWANYRSPRSSSGWSSRGGQTRNPYALDRTPGGSSSGSAVAVAAGMCVAAIGTETDGSIVSPSSMNSVVGIKPTVGLVSRSGIIPISDSQDTAGPIARCVADAAAVLAAIRGVDPADPVTARYRPAGTGCSPAGGLRGARIGLARNYCGYNENVDRIVAAALETLQTAGATIVDDLTLTPMSDIRPHEVVVMSTEFKAGLNRYLNARPAATEVRSMADLIAFNRQNSAHVMPYFQQELLELSIACGDLDDTAYLSALAECRRLARDVGIDGLTTRHQLDAIITPTTCPAWRIDWVNGDNRAGASACAAAVAGYPSITVPAGYVFGLPVGLSFFSTAGRDDAMIRLAGEFEQVTALRQRPRFLPELTFE